MPKLNVLVVGASIAGPTAAYWLAKAGAKVTVIERFPKLRTNGQNVDIRTSGVTVMRRMPGMEAAVRAKTTPLNGISFVGDDGRPYGTIKPTGNPDQQSLVSEYEIFRGDLAQILVDMTKDTENIQYIFGEQVASMRQDKEGDGLVTVEFANGLPSSEYDLVVACDGSTSRTRAIGLGCGVQDHAVPLNWWAAYFTVERDLLEGGKVGQAYSAVGGKFLALGPDPSGVTRVALMAVLPRNDREALLPFRAALKQGDDGTALKKFVAQHYKGGGWKTDEVVRAMMDAKDFYGSEIVQIKPPTLHKGRFALVGDAGYAGSAGSGTTLAITGAYVLAGEIARHPGDLAAGLRAYEERMAPLVKELQKLPPLVPTIFAPQTAWGIWLRNNVFAFIAWTRILELAQKYFAGSFASSDKYPLPDYEWVE
jgi:2-polyprenyl-6-methoxyphenol hydroxylase-like FAD-dependent oxidoreductase